MQAKNDDDEIGKGKERKTNTEKLIKTKAPSLRVKRFSSSYIKFKYLPTIIKY